MAFRYTISASEDFTVDEIDEIHAEIGSLLNRVVPGRIFKFTITESRKERLKTNPQPGEPLFEEDTPKGRAPKKAPLKAVNE